jgi:hypothetical protein
VGPTGCDEYVPASTHESGGFPGGVNQVSDNQCAQRYTHWSFNGVGDGSTLFGLFADARTAANGPTGPGAAAGRRPTRRRTRGPFHKLQPSVWRLLDGNGFFADTPWVQPLLGGRGDLHLAQGLSIT